MTAPPLLLLDVDGPLDPYAAEPQDAAWIAAHHPGPAATLRINPRKGLRPGDFAALREWACGGTGAGG
ncbi:hypothetical protein ACFXAF_02660 [Kitasatospora sp. NPDC059463]|uniref:hypothetical protein n=1 Tax=unclassified Kitasatospora TaxID=2633591 RepID=UPI003679D977